MAEIAKSGVPSVASLGLDAVHKITGLVSGEAIAAGDLCYINTNGLVYRASGAAANANAKARGLAIVACQQGEAVTLLRLGRVRYGANLTPGATYYLSGTVTGGIADAASTGGTTPVGFAVDSTRIEFQIDPV